MESAGANFDATVSYAVADLAAASLSAAAAAAILTATATLTATAVATAALAAAAGAAAAAAFTAAAGVAAAATASSNATAAGDAAALRRAALLVLLAYCARARAWRWAWCGVDESHSLIRTARRERRGRARRCFACRRSKASVSQRFDGFARDFVRQAATSSGCSTSFTTTAPPPTTHGITHSTTAHAGVSAARGCRRHAQFCVNLAGSRVTLARSRDPHCNATSARPRLDPHCNAISARPRLHTNRGALRVPCPASRGGTTTGGWLLLGRVLLG